MGASRGGPATALPLGVALAAVRRARAEHPDGRAPSVGDPSYVGAVGGVAGLAEVAHAHGIPLGAQRLVERLMRSSQRQQIDSGLRGTQSTLGRSRGETEPWSVRTGGGRPDGQTVAASRAAVPA